MNATIAVILALLVAAAQTNPIVPVESEASDAVPAVETVADSSSVAADDSLPAASTNTLLTATTHPVSIQETPEVAAPVAADDSLPSASTNTLVTAAALPVPVQDTPEVAAAKRDHAVQWLAAKAATDAAILRNSVAVVPAAAVAAPVSGSVVSTPVGTPLINTHSLAAHPLAYINMIGQHPLAYSNMMINPWGYNLPLSHLGYNYGVLPSSITGQRILTA